MESPQNCEQSLINILIYRLLIIIQANLPLNHDLHHRILVHLEEHHLVGVTYVHISDAKHKCRICVLWHLLEKQLTNLFHRAAIVYEKVKILPTKLNGCY